jgi:hypothetical protein
VREAEAADVAACVGIIMAVNGGDEEGWRAMFTRTIAAADQALFVAEVDGEIAGYARIVHHTMSPCPPSRGAGAGWRRH